MQESKQRQSTMDSRNTIRKLACKMENFICHLYLRHISNEMDVNHAA